MLTGCGTDTTNSGPAVSFRDSAGIRIAENPSPDDSALHIWWRVEGPEVDIGGVDATEEYALFRVADALRLADGRIVVGSGGSNDIRIYDPAGTHLRTVGRSGGGPGEYQNVSGLERGPADSLLVLDRAARRVSVLDAHGEYARAFDAGSAALVPRIVGRFADGSLLAAPALLIAPGDLETRQNEITRPDLTLVRITPEGAVGDTLRNVPGAERVVNVATRGAEIISVSIMGVPFAKSSTFAVYGDEVYVGSQDAAEIAVYGEDGALRRIVRTGRSPERVTDAHLAAAYERELESMPEELRAQARAAGRNTERPHGDFVPPYGEITTDLEGNLWVADYDDPLDPPGRWTVYGTDGGALARIILPARFRPFDIGQDWVLGRALDDLDVEHVRLYRLVKSGRS